MIDMFTIPDRLKHEIRKPEDHDILHRLFAEEMIDAVNLALVGDLQKACVQRFGRGKIVAERLFDDDAPPTVLALL